MFYDGITSVNHFSPWECKYHSPSLSRRKCPNLSITILKNLLKRVCNCASLILTVVKVDLAGPVQEWKDLAPVDDGSNQYLGDLCISLRYVPSSGKLTG